MPRKKITSDELRKQIEADERLYPALWSNQRGIMPDEDLRGIARRLWRKDGRDTVEGIERLLKGAK